MEAIGDGQSTNLVYDITKYKNQSGSSMQTKQM